MGKSEGRRRFNIKFCHFQQHHSNQTQTSCCRCSGPVRDDPGAHCWPWYRAELQRPSWEKRSLTGAANLSWFRQDSKCWNVICPRQRHPSALLMLFMSEPTLSPCGPGGRSQQVHQLVSGWIRFISSLLPPSVSIILPLWPFLSDCFTWIRTELLEVSVL